MSDYLINTNCLISYTTTRNKNQTEKISKYIEDAFKEAKIYEKLNSKILSKKPI